MALTGDRALTCASTARAMGRVAMDVQRISTGKQFPKCEPVSRPERVLGHERTAAAGKVADELQQQLEARLARHVRPRIVERVEQRLLDAVLASTGRSSRSAKVRASAVFPEAVPQ